jgi:hypothetical protein
MKTSLDCLPCLYKQALYTIRLCTKDPDLQRKVLNYVGRLLNDLDLSLSPPENSVSVYETIAERCAVRDPFGGLKRRGNDAALKMRPQIIEKINRSEDPILAAVKFAIAGNIIDYGSHQKFDIQQTLHKCLTAPAIIDDYKEFRSDLEKADNILYLADNCGEIVFDGILIERLNKKITLAVKEFPIINDALLEDVYYCGLDTFCTPVSNGTGCPGTPVEECSEVFKEIFHSADLIISKGQGNFETLSETAKPIYFLLQVKCPIVGRHIKMISGCGKQIQTGEMVLMKQKNRALP